MSWFQIDVPKSPESGEGIANFLFELGALGLEENTTHLHAYFSADVYSEAFLTSINLYLDNLRTMGFQQPVGEVTVSEIPDKDWNAIWRKHFKPLAVSKHFIVRPPWEKYEPKADERIIVIDPKMAFGTGSHETTQLMLQLMEKYDFKNKTVLDAGTGTAILSIAASFMAAGPIDAFDIDPIAIECAQECIVENGCGEAVSLKATDITEYSNAGAKYDILLANIQRHIILGMKTELNMVLNPGGLFFASGILIEHEAEVISEFEIMDMKLLEYQHMAEWTGIVFQKKQAK